MWPKIPEGNVRCRWGRQHTASRPSRNPLAPRCTCPTPAVLDKYLRGRISRRARRTTAIWGRPAAAPPSVFTEWRWLLLEIKSSGATAVTCPIWSDNAALRATRPSSARYSSPKPQPCRLYRSVQGEKKMRTINRVANTQENAHPAMILGSERRRARGTDRDRTGVRCTFCGPTTCSHRYSTAQPR